MNHVQLSNKMKLGEGYNRAEFQNVSNDAEAVIE